MSEAPTPPVTRLRLDISYDGSQFHGWAKQPGLRTVQGEIEQALAVLTRTEHPAQLTVGGRTDAGVHARGQVAHIDLAEPELESWLRDASHGGSIDEPLLTRRLNGMLRRTAEDVEILSVGRVSQDFDARFSALWRRYEYRIADGYAPREPLARHFTVSVPSALSLELLSEASTALLGLNDFTSFCKAREGATSVRTLQTFSWVRDDHGVLVASIQADAFCHSMVRALVGAVTAVAGGKLTLDELMALRDARERTNRFAVMPAHGLSLDEIGYPAAEELSARAEQTRARREALS